jgi:hypothetical protein
VNELPTDLPIDSLISPGIGEPPAPQPIEVPDAEGKELRPSELPVPGVHYVEWEGKEWAVARRASVTEEQYVRTEVEGTVRYVKTYAIRDKRLNAKGEYVTADPKLRLQRTAEYARWRYRGYLAGGVESL